MNEAQIALVQSSFIRALPNADELAAQFYARLFALDPTLRALFPPDMQTQHEKLLTMLVVVVRGLPRLEHLLPLIEALGRRHAVYGVTEGHYALTELALMGALEWELGDGWSIEVAAAWRAAYALMTDAMRNAAAAMVAELPD